MRDETGNKRHASTSERERRGSEGHAAPPAVGRSHRQADDGRPLTSPAAREGTRAAETTERIAAHRWWVAVAAACAVTAAALLFTAGVNAAFVVAVLGAVAWFWDQRNRIRANLIENENPKEGRDELEESVDEVGGSDEGDEGEPGGKETGER